MRISKLIIIIFCCLSFCYISIASLFAQEQAKQVKESTVENQPQGVISRPKEEFDTKGLRDPFRDYFEGGGPEEQNGETQGPVEFDVPLPSLTVQGVISGGRINQAIINNKVLKAGDTIEGAMITDIDKSGITVFFSNKSHKISSPAATTEQELIKKPEGGKDEK